MGGLGQGQRSNLSTLKKHGSQERGAGSGGQEERVVQSKQRSGQGGGQGRGQT